MRWTYAFLEGIFKAFLAEKDPIFQADQLNVMAKRVRDIIAAEVGLDYPENLIKFISNVANNISETRNKFSDSHFDKAAKMSMAQLIRDMVNSIGRFVI